LEQIRRNDKTVTNAIGLFHEHILASVNGWEHIGKSLTLQRKYHMDIANTEHTIFIEVKNKHNTMNNASATECMRRFKNLRNQYSECTVYLGIINDTTESNTVWNAYSNTDDRIRRVSGSLLYKLITGIPDAMQQVLNAIPKVISDLHMT